MKKNILISVIIPVKNGDYWLDDTLISIKKQSLYHITEIIVIDSGSSDLSLEIIKRHDVRLIQVEPSSFNHGLTRNIGVEAALGDYVVMTVQDAKPVDKYWLQNLLNGFNDNSVAGVCGQQIVPHDLDKNPIEWFRPQSPPNVKKFFFPIKEQFNKLSPAEKRHICGWDNVTAMYRKKILQEIPFKEINFAEDALWAKDALLSGYSIVYNTAARVYHYHLSKPDYVLRRQFTIFYHFYNYFNYTPQYSGNEYRKLLSNIKTLFTIKELSFAQKIYWLKYNWQLRRSIKQAVKIFNNNLRTGEDALKLKHQELCGFAPAAIKPES